MRSSAPVIPEFLTKRKEKIIQDVQHYLTTTLPEKINQLSSLESDPRFDLSRLLPPKRDIDTDTKENEIIEPPSKKRTSNGTGGLNNNRSGVIRPNEVIKELYGILKPELRFLLRVCLKVSVWIQLLIPRIEDGNNFGVSVQESILEEIGRIQQDLGSYVDAFARYHANRSKMISRLIKYPLIDDGYDTVREIDEKEFLNLQIICSELPNYYHSIFDILVKNYQKLTCPRSDHHGSMY